MPTDLPFSVEYAKSSRASCKGCKGGITKDSLRVGIMVQSPMFDGKIPHWHHYNCFVAKRKKKGYGEEGDYHGFDNLRWDDQEKIRNVIAGKEVGDEGGAASSVAADQEDPERFGMEYAKSSRSSCRSCEKSIIKAEVRVAKKAVKGGGAGSGYDQWYHLACFGEKATEFGCFFSAKEIPGFSSLSKEDQELAETKIKGEKKKKRKQDSVKDEAPAAKVKKGASKAGSSKSETSAPVDDLGAQLKEQSQALWKIKDSLQEFVHKKDLIAILEENEQAVPAGESKLIDQVAECMLFGPTDSCPECEKGQLVFSSSSNSYQCNGNVSGWTKCQYSTAEPKRRKLVISEDFKEHEYLGSFKFKKGRKRILSKKFSSKKDSDGASGSPVKDEVNILTGVRIVVAGKHLDNPSSLVIEKLRAFGAEVTPTVASGVALLISSEKDVSENHSEVKKAKKNKVTVVDEKFVDSLKKDGDLTKLIEKSAISDWGYADTKELQQKLEDSRLKSTKSGPKKSSSNGSSYTKSVPKSMKLTLKGGAAVDAECEVSDVTHIYKDKAGNIHGAVLNLVDVQRGSNSFYKLQLLQHDTKESKFYLYRAWGRLGTTIGGNKLERFDLNSGVAEFKRIYLEKTGNRFEDRDNFVKQPNKFFPVDVSYDEQDEPKNKIAPGSKSKLPLSVQDIVSLIFDVNQMKETMKEFEIDLNKMPLGKLSKKQIKSAYSVLKDLQKLMASAASQVQILDASNQFYTLIPHDFGMEKPPLLDSEDIIKKKVEMLDSLLEIELAYSILKSGDGESETDPLDEHYEKLRTEITPMKKDTTEYKQLLEYVENTHAPTHTMYRLEVEEIFEVKRDGEADRFGKFSSLHNRMLLWHGSRMSNYAGILSQGLRIAPPEAPVTGYMFGKGVYFADMVTKSANYCYPNRHMGQTTGLMMLCDVALGNMWELKGAKMITKLPEGKHSTKGLGCTMPDPSANVKNQEGVTIPKGLGIDSGLRDSSLLYNEYIVYDVDQINIKYLFKMKFNYR